MSRSFVRSVLAGSATMLMGSAAFAWGPVGHRTVAYIAQDRLSTNAKKEVEKLLRDEDLADAANWADDVRNDREFTREWHFIDLPVRQAVKKSDFAKFCSDDACVTQQIANDKKLLTTGKHYRWERTEALKFLIHFVGDLHQPLHCANDDDRGGNLKLLQVKPAGQDATVKLHGFWDGLLEAHTSEDPRTLATQLGAKISAEQAKSWAQGEVEDWALESYVLARDTIYPAFEPGPTSGAVPLPDMYRGQKLAQVRKLVDLQLEKAGVRLAFILNSIFGG